MQVFDCLPFSAVIWPLGGGAISALLSGDIRLNVITNSCDRVYLCVRLYEYRHLMAVTSTPSGEIISALACICSVDNHYGNHAQGDAQMVRLARTLCRFSVALANDRKIDRKIDR